MQPKSSTSVLPRLFPITLGHFPLSTKCLHPSPSWLVSALYSGLFQLLGSLSDRAIGFQGLRGHFHEDVLDLVSSQAYFILVGNNAAFNQWWFNMVPFWAVTKVR